MVGVSAVWMWLSFVTVAYQRGSSQVTASPPNQDNVTLAPIFVLDGNLIPGSWCECRQTSNEDCMCHGAGLLEIPSNLSTTLKTLTVSNAGIRTLTANCLQPYKNTLRDVTFSNVKRLEHIEPGVFNLLKELRSIYIHNAPLLRRIPSGVFQLYLPRLIYLRIVHTGLEKLPYFGRLKTNAALHMIDLENNQIQAISSHEVEVHTDQLLLNFNMIQTVENEAFKGSQIAKLSLKGNKGLKVLQSRAFVGVLSLRQLDLSNTAIEYLPTEGLKELDVLKIEATYSMKVFPSIYNFQLIKEAWLTYPYHCCAFHFPATHDPDQYAKHQEFIKANAVGCGRRRRSVNNSTLIDDFNSPWGNPLPVDTPHTGADSLDGFFHEKLNNLSGARVNATCGTLSKNYHEVRCHPAPDAFNPCEDLMGNWALRVSVWFVAIAALVGNLAVLLVLISSRFRMTVPKFLMCNLAFADFCMGLYLIMIAIMDVRSIGDYFNHAIYWQRGMGCQMAGFLTVFSSVLSIFTLTVITCERWYTITYAIHLNRRLKLSTATKIMVVGWVYSIAMAALPLFDVSNYSKTSICLPMKNTNSTDSAYLIFLLLFNGLAFWMICACYARMYSSIRGGTEGVASLARSDMTVARRMALLVFTDFACWAPIAFFGLTALAGYPLIDVPKTKILLVFFYPLNSCANPYLYALLTQQYRRDFFILLSRYGICSARAARYKGTPGTFRKSGHNAHTVTEGNERDMAMCGPQHRGSLLTTVTSVDSYPVHNTRYNVNTSPNNNTEVTSLQHLEMMPFDYNNGQGNNSHSASNRRQSKNNTSLI